MSNTRRSSHPRPVLWYRSGAYWTISTRRSARRLHQDRRTTRAGCSRSGNNNSDLDDSPTILSALGPNPSGADPDCVGRNRRGRGRRSPSRTPPPPCKVRPLDFPSLDSHYLLGDPSGIAAVNNFRSGQLARRRDDIRLYRGGKPAGCHHTLVPVALTMRIRDR
jgi:hypothetical protein